MSDLNVELSRAFIRVLGSDVVDVDSRLAWAQWLVGRGNKIRVSTIRAGTEKRLEELRGIEARICGAL